jgi:hypothetical protein
VIRKQYLLMLELIPPKDAAKRKEFFMKKLTHASTKLSQLMDHRDSAIDALFADIDKSVMQVRDSLRSIAHPGLSHADRGAAPKLHLTRLLCSPPLACSPVPPLFS